MEELKRHRISIAEVIQSRGVVGRFIKPTQLIYYEGLSKLIGAAVYVKHENHNPTGTFKIRGGVNLMSHLRDKGVTGVITFSTGNHGLSIATSAKWFGLSAVVVVPENNNPAKNRAIRESGAELVEAGKTFEEASQAV
ncbi:MAG: pyridoxal-phosphate dependent enzyme, partial [Gemmatimonadota bacterium]